MFPSIQHETRKDVDNFLYIFILGKLLFGSCLLLWEIFFCFPFSLWVATGFFALLFRFIVLDLYSFVSRLSATLKEVGRLRSEKAELEERLEVLQKRRYFTTAANKRGANLLSVGARVAQSPPHDPHKWPEFKSQTQHHMWFEFRSGSRPCFEGFLRVFQFYSLPKTITKFKLDLHSHTLRN